MQLKFNFRYGKNKTGSKVYQMDGQSRTLADWAFKYGIGYQTVYRRLELGWTLSKALKTRPLWKTNGSSGEPVVGSKWQLEEELNETPLDKLPKKFRKLVKTLPYKGKTPYSGRFYGRFLREACRKEFDAYWKYRYQPKKLADYYHDKHTKISEQKLSGMAATSEGPRYPELDLKRLPLSQSSVAQLAAYAG